MVVLMGFYTKQKETSQLAPPPQRAWTRAIAQVIGELQREMVAYLCIVAILAIPAARAVERTICKFTIDNRVSLADVDGVSLHIAGNINDWRVVKTIEFDGDAERLTICGYDDDDSYPSTAGFLLKCTGGWWDGVKSDTSWYVTHGDGRDVYSPMGQVRKMQRHEWDTYWSYGANPGMAIHYPGYKPAMEITKAVESTSNFNCGGGLCDEGDKIWGKRGKAIGCPGWGTTCPQAPGYPSGSTYYVNYPICFTKFVPRSDSECDGAKGLSSSSSSFNLKCQFTSHCEYRYKFGDFSVDASCRLKDQTECGAGTCSSSGRTPCTDSTEYRDRHCDAGFVQPEPMFVGRSCREPGLDLGKGFKTPLDCIEAAEKQGCAHIMYSEAGQVEMGAMGGVTTSADDVTRCYCCDDDVCQTSGRDRISPPEPLQNIPPACGTRGTNLNQGGVVLHTLVEALEFAATHTTCYLSGGVCAQRWDGTRCEHIMFAPDSRRVTCCEGASSDSSSRTSEEKIYAVPIGMLPSHYSIYVRLGVAKFASARASPSDRRARVARRPTHPRRRCPSTPHAPFRRLRPRRPPSPRHRRRRRRPSRRRRCRPSRRRRRRPSRRRPRRPQGPRGRLRIRCTTARANARESGKVSASEPCARP